jgi:hypothetical protein
MQRLSRDFMPAGAGFGAEGCTLNGLEMGRCLDVYGARN